MKLMTRRAAGIAGTVVLLAGIGATPAYAADGRAGTKVSDPNGACADNSVGNTHVQVCYLDYGDKLYVKDKEADGRSAYGYITWPDKEPCRNSYGAGTWVMCNYDIPEDMRILYKGYTQDNEGYFNPWHDEMAETSEWS